MKRRLLLTAALVLTAVVGFSLLSASLWGDRPEQIDLPELTIPSNSVTPAQIIRRHNLPPKPVLKALGVDSTRAATATLADLGLTPQQAKAKISSTLIKFSEEQSKNWRKIALKFLLWFLILPIPFVLLLKRKITPRRRLILLGLGVVTFGIALGADPSPMGTVKDAVYLIAAHETVFVPRIIALFVFLLTVVLANKFICSWGCQFGLLQEFLFRLNRRRFDRKGLIRQYKPPFWLSNTIRVIVFLVFTAIALLWAFDVIGLIDPFKIYNPAVLTGVGIAFLTVLLIASLFVYRPWCHFACPFGLVSWLFEKLSVFRIKVDYTKCDACNLCHRACPSSVMEAIIKQDKKTIPDCFSCGTCIDVCPQDAIRFTARRTDQGTWADSLRLREIKRTEKKSASARERFKA